MELRRIASHEFPKKAPTPGVGISNENQLQLVVDENGYQYQLWR